VVETKLLVRAVWSGSSSYVHSSCWAVWLSCVLCIWSSSVCLCLCGCGW